MLDEQHHFTRRPALYPLLREMICVFLVLTECRGRGRVQIRVSLLHGLTEQPLFGSPEHEVDFASVSPVKRLVSRSGFGIVDSQVRAPTPCSSGTMVLKLKNAPATTVNVMNHDAGVRIIATFDDRVVS